MKLLAIVPLLAALLMVGGCSAGGRVGGEEHGVSANGSINPDSPRR